MEAIDEPIKTIGTITWHSIFNQMQLVSKPRRNDAFDGQVRGCLARQTAGTPVSDRSDILSPKDTVECTARRAAAKEQLRKI